MTHHRSNVNFKKLIQDLADMYIYPVPEVVLTELVANSLDAGATHININYDIKKRILTVEDNGAGMTENQFKEYHDFAAKLKSRGDGIGFAGLGAKISFNVASRVVTETRSSSFVGGSNWYLASENELVWDDFQITNKLKGKGTLVEVYFNESENEPFIDEDEIINILKKQYLPLFDKSALELYSRFKRYSPNLTFSVNGKVLDKFDIEKAFCLEKAKRFFLQTKGKRYGFGCFGLSQTEYPLGEDAAGIAICVFGKVVQYDYLKQYLGDIAARIFGFVEIPPLIEFLNTSKSGFIKHRSTAAKFRMYNEPVREEFKKWLSEIGIKSVEMVESEKAIKLEQEIKKLINQLPELLNFFGLSIKRDIKQPRINGEIAGSIVEGADITYPNGEGQKGKGEGPVDEGIGPFKSFREEKEGKYRASPISRTRRAGIRISFDNKPDRKELAWLDGNIVVINLGHKSYLKIKSDSKARKLHNIFSIALCLEREMKEQQLLDSGDLFIERMMSAWGNIK